MERKKLNIQFDENIASDNFDNLVSESRLLTMNQSVHKNELVFRATTNLVYAYARQQSKKFLKTLLLQEVKLKNSVNL